MSSKSKLSLVSAFVAFLSTHESADAVFVQKAGPVLLQLLKERKVGEVRAEWRRLNVVAYSKLGLRKGSQGYSLVARRSSMLLSIGLRNSKTLEQLCRKYTSLQGVYGKASKKAKAASRKPLSFRQKLVRFLSNATSAQLKMVRSNFRAILAEAAA